MLTKTERRRYQTRLRAERDRAARMIDQSNRAQVSDAVAGDLSDRASLETDRELDQLISSRESDAVGAIDEALRVLTKSPKSFGICRVCGKPIALERLDVLPWTLTCLRHSGAI